jgi:hypothetical protein
VLNLCRSSESTLITANEENAAKFKYLGTALTNQNDIHDEIKRRLNSGYALLSFSPKSFVFPYHNKKPKDQNIQNCNFSSCAVWVRNMVSHFEGGTQTEGF